MYIKLNKYRLKGFSDTADKIGYNIDRIENEFSSIGKRLDWDVKECSGIDNTIAQITREMEVHSKTLKSMSKFLILANDKYTHLDREGQGMLEQVLEPTSAKSENLYVVSNILKWFGMTGMGNVLIASGPAMVIIDLIQSYIKDGNEKYKEFNSIAKDFNTIYMEGIKDVDKIFGMISDVNDTNISFGKEFKKQLNELSDSFKNLKDIDIKTSAGLGKLFTILDVALSGVYNAVENFTIETDEYGNKLTFERALKETITETVVDVGKGLALGAAAQTVVAAGVTAIGGAPVLIATGLTVGLTFVGSKLLDEGAKKLTGKDFTEFMSDAYLDIKEKFDPKVNAPKKPSKPPVVNWA